METKIIQLKEPSLSLFKVDLNAVMTIAGSDSSGGAGIEADLKTFSAFGVYGLTCITALTAQNTTGVRRFDKTGQKLAKEILAANLEDMLYAYTPDTAPLKVIKTGMLTNKAIAELIDQMPKINEYSVKLIVDPVMISTSGSKLSDDNGMKLCVDKLMNQAFLVTPNFPEAMALYELIDGTERKITINSMDDFIEFVISLQKSLGCKNILVKGGHIPFTKNNKPVTNYNHSNAQIRDILYESELERVTVFQSAYIDSNDNHGSGCTLASAISANVAKGLLLEDSILISIDFIHRGMISLANKLGFGNSPLNHTVTPAHVASSVIKTSNSMPTTFLNQSGEFLDYLINHPDVNNNWKNYTEHKFVKDLAENNLPFNKFLYFLKQDYHYLVNYAQVHGLAASLAPTYQQTHAQATIIAEIVEEIERHKQKLSTTYNIDYETDIDLDLELSPGPACMAYCNYLLEVGKREDFLGVKVALAPCLHGYAEAAVMGQKIRKRLQNDGVVDNEQAAVYQSWLDDYTSDWYTHAESEGRKALQLLVKSMPPNDKRIEELVRIFNRVTLLEIDFWDEVLNI